MQGNKRSKKQTFKEKKHTCKETDIQRNVQRNKRSEKQTFREINIQTNHANKTNSNKTYKQTMQINHKNRQSNHTNK